MHKHDKMMHGLFKDRKMKWRISYSPLVGGALLLINPCTLVGQYQNITCLSGLSSCRSEAMELLSKLQRGKKGGAIVSMSILVMCMELNERGPVW